MVDVIIVNFNAGEYLTQCVKSVLASTIPTRVFVSDNGSSDNSLSLLNDYLNAQNNKSLVKIIENKANLGFAKANNIAYQYTQSPYILFLNPDCFLETDTLEKMLLEMDKFPNAGMSGCLIKNPDGSEQVGCRRSFPTPWRTLIRVLRLNKWFPNNAKFMDFNLTNQPLPDAPEFIEGISGAFMLTRRKAIDEVGLLDENYFLHCEDLDWFMRFQQAGWRVLFVPHISIVHIKGACSARRPIRVLWHKHFGMQRFYGKFFRKDYSILLFGLVSVAIWIRFALLAALNFMHIKRD